MDFRICTMGDRVQYETVHIPFEFETISMQSIWESVESVWTRLCLVRDRAYESCGQLIQHSLRFRREELGRLDKEFKKKWFFPPNAVRYMRMLLEWCDEYVPVDIGLRALKEILFNYDIAASYHLLYRYKNTVNAKKGMTFPIAASTLFNYDYILTSCYFSASFTTHIVASAYASNTDIYEYRGCMYACIDNYYKEKYFSGSEVPMIFLNPYVCKAIFYEHYKNGEFTFPDVVSIPALYLTITALQKYHYGDFDDPLTDIVYFWRAMQSLAAAADESLHQSFATLRSSCNDLERGAIALRKSLSH